MHAFCVYQSLAHSISVDADKTPPLPSCRDIHVHDPDAQAESGLTNADRRLLIGALEYKDKRFVTSSALCV
jgi:hypothetical protein